MKELFEMNLTQKEDIELTDTEIGEILISITGEGEFHGDELNGKVLPVGMGKSETPAQGNNNIVIPMLLKTDDGEKILMEVYAIFDIEPSKEEKMIKGEYVSPEEYYYKGVVKFYTGGKYKSLERKVCTCEIEIIDWSNLKLKAYMV